MSDGYGRSLPASLASYDPDTRLWRTSQACLWPTEGQRLDKFSATWPRSGMMLNGTVYPQLRLVPRTSVTGCSSWPTPQASEATHGGPNARDSNGKMHLSAMAARWPTPQASDHRDRGNLSDPCIQRRIAKGKQINLSMAAKDGATSGALNPTWVEWLMGFPSEWTDLNASETP